MNELLIHKAIEFAAVKHRDQKRKGTETPYITHLMEVYGILAASDCDEETVIAGILHDTVEDTDTEIEEIIALFGENVATLVASESENKSKTWQERKQQTIDELRTAPINVKRICCADKLSNIISMYADYQKCGEDLWKRFNAEKSRIDWYYKEIVKALSELNRFTPYVLLQEYYKKIFEE
jgi:(p)ppGpp synthase/HD superfamily hydrolase